MILDRTSLSAFSPTSLENSASAGLSQAELGRHFQSAANDANSAGKDSLGRHFSSFIDGLQQPGPLGSGANAPAPNAAISSHGKEQPQNGFSMDVKRPIAPQHREAVEWRRNLSSYSNRASMFSAVVRSLRDSLKTLSQG